LSVTKDFIDDPDISHMFGKVLDVGASTDKIEPRMATAANARPTRIYGARIFPSRQDSLLKNDE
jgi:hypothetical protein